jgi:hypothetical protein
MKKFVAILVLASVCFCLANQANAWHRIRPFQRMRSFVQDKIELRHKIEGRRTPTLNPKITASATQIVAGEQAIVMWTNTTDTVLCTLNGQAVALNGQQEVYPIKDATYSIIAYDRKGNTQASWVRIDVLPAKEKRSTTQNYTKPSPGAAEGVSCESGSCPSGQCGEGGRAFIFGRRR